MIRLIIITRRSKADYHDKVHGCVDIISTETHNMVTVDAIDATKLTTMLTDAMTYSKAVYSITIEKLPVKEMKKLLDSRTFVSPDPQTIFKLLGVKP